ncbi:MAG: hypothetical protein IT323_13995 [Anaerolineae bacterium]|nr:hypothetical protein [Anaerolineae bacterium]
MFRRTVVLALIGLMTLSVLPVSPVSAQAGGETPLTYAPPGPYAVGTQEIRLEDPERPLDATVWYPALADGGARTASYPLFGPGKALVDAAPDMSGAPYPVIVFSHGFSGTRFQSTFLTEHLASYGFVVIAANHPGTDLAAIGIFNEREGVPLARLSAVAAKIIRDFALRPSDVFRQLDELERLSAPGGVFAGLADTSRSAVSGHSFGGYTTVAASGARLDFAALRDWCAENLGGPDSPMIVCTFMNVGPQVAQARGLDPYPAGLFPATSDPRIRSALALAPWNAPAFGPAGLAAVEIPMMVMVGSADSTTPPARDADAIYAGISSRPRYAVTLEGASHSVFVGPCGDDLGGRCRDAVWEPSRAYDVIGHFAAAFFLSTLYRDAEAENALRPDGITLPGVSYKADLP